MGGQRVGLESIERIGCFSLSLPCVLRRDWTWYESVHLPVKKIRRAIWLNQTGFRLLHISRRRKIAKMHPILFSITVSFESRLRVRAEWNGIKEGETTVVVSHPLARGNCVMYCSSPWQNDGTVFLSLHDGFVWQVIVTAGGISIHTASSKRKVQQGIW